MYNVPVLAYSEDGLSLIATQIGKPIMLDAFTSSMCVESWGRISFARALIEVSASSALKKEVIMAVLEDEGDGYVKGVIRVEYEWKPPHCVDCQSFGHDSKLCPKRVREEVPKNSARDTKTTTMEENDDGFTEVKSRKKKKGVDFGGIRPNKPKSKVMWQQKKGVDAKSDSTSPFASSNAVGNDKGVSNPGLNTSNPFDVLNVDGDAMGESRTQPKLSEYVSSDLNKNRLGASKPSSSKSVYGDGHKDKNRSSPPVMKKWDVINEDDTTDDEDMFNSYGGSLGGDNQLEDEDFDFYEGYADQVVDIDGALKEFRDFKLSMSVARSQRNSVNGSQLNHNITTKDENLKPNPSSYPNNIPLKNKDKFPDLPSFASVTYGIAKPIVDTSLTNANIRALVLDDQDLIYVEDPSMVLLVKLKDVNSMSNMYVICRNEGFTELKIHLVGGLWVWIQFPSSSSADSFQTNASLKSVYSCIKPATPSFKVNERGDENSLADLNDFNDMKETINELASNKIQHPISKENMDQDDDINKVSHEIAVSLDLSRHLCFEHMKRTSIKCSTSFARYRKKDIKGVAFIEELSRIIEVGDSLESNMTRLETFRLKSMWDNYNFDFAYSIARGRSEGLISMWDPNSFIKDDIWCNDAFIIMKGHWRNTVSDCYLINIYGPQDSLAKAILRNRIGHFMHQHAELPKLEEHNFGRKLLSHEKFRLLKARIKQWHSETKTSDRVTKHDKLLLIKSIEEKIKAGFVNDDDCDFCIKLLQEVNILDTFESFDLFQKARIKWDIENNDSNVNFPQFANFSGLCAFDRDSLETSVSLDEVKNAVWNYGSSKAPGPAKILVNRLAKVIDKIVSHEQSALIACRQIPDGPLILVEIVEWFKKKKKKLLIFKVDFEIAFDSVFYFASGLKINIQKSSIYGIGVSDVDVSSMASFIEQVSIEVIFMEG
uniref:RNA-directed DNA polymerase, eukaryota, reverse transcriptase zinc-binding domain protein n=1 Tax=Tanacetum cinerariifolium TaxID=118510 RepID=A0A6L2JLJ4_TANCI|nr:RNA-directed DNA polymerase, eukaryota, reverse transcriptase zinc-binding domain protein [Tanacetum cinerariifolium]